MKGLFAVAFLVLILAFMPNERKRDKTPPGTVRINDTLFMDKWEVGNVHWREFLFWLENNKDSLGYEENKTDTSVWLNVEAHEDYADHYHYHPMFNYCPVVGLDYEQVAAYCKWRSDRVNQLYELKPSLNPFPGKKYRYRLPTEGEWELAAMNHLDVKDYPYGLPPVKVKYKKWMVPAFRCYYDTTDSPQKRKDVLVATIDSYYPNSYNLHHMIGNVSEMVSEKGIAKGGNFLLPLDSCKIKLEQHYTKPEAWLGFRCVCEIVN